MTINLPGDDNMLCVVRLESKSWEGDILIPGPKDPNINESAVIAEYVSMIQEHVVDPAGNQVRVASIALYRLVDTVSL